MSDRHSDRQPTACILCECNCGIEVQLDGRTAEPGSAATRRTPRRRATPARRRMRLDHYQNGRAPADLAAAPARRTARFEEIDWDTAIREVAARLRGASATRTAASRSSTTAAAARGTTSAAPTRRRPARRSASRYRSNALAQEKTGEFWVDGAAVRPAGCHTRGDFEHAEVAVFVGKNPWQSHGFPRARVDAARRSPSDPGARADRHRPAPHRDRRARRHPPAGAAGHRRVVPRRAARRCSSQEDLVDARLPRRARATASRRCSPRSREVADRRLRRARAGVDEDAGARGRAAHRARPTSVVDLRGPRHPAGAAQHAELATWRSCSGCSPATSRKPGAHEHPHRASRRCSAAATGGGAAHARSAGAPHHHRPGPVQRDPRRDPHRPPRPLPGDARRERATRRTRSPTRQRMREALDALELRRRDRRRDDRDRAPRRLRAAGRHPVREVGGDVLHPRVPRATPSTCAGRCSSRSPGTLPEPEIHAPAGARRSASSTTTELAPLRAAAARGPRRVRAGVLRSATAADPTLGRLAPVVLYETLGPTLPDGAAAARRAVGRSPSAAR